MNEIRPPGIEAIQIEALEERELLQQHRPLTPGAGFAYGKSPILIGERPLDLCRPARHVVTGQHAPVGLATGVHQRLGAEKAVDRLGDEALTPGLARPLDLPLAIPARASRL